MSCEGFYVTSCEVFYVTSCEGFYVTSFEGFYVKSCEGFWSIFFKFQKRKTNLKGVAVSIFAFKVWFLKQLHCFQGDVRWAPPLPALFFLEIQNWKKSSKLVRISDQAKSFFVDLFNSQGCKYTMYLHMLKWWFTNSEKLGGALMATIFNHWS